MQVEWVWEHQTIWVLTVWEGGVSYSEFGLIVGAFFDQNSANYYVSTHPLYKGKQYELEEVELFRSSPVGYSK